MMKMAEDSGLSFKDDNLDSLPEYDGTLLKKAVKNGHFFGEIENDDVKIDLTKEYGLLYYYNSYLNKDKITALLSFFKSAMDLGQWNFLNLGEMQASFDEYFKYLTIKKQYMELQKESPIPLNLTRKGFHVNEHTFQTLDEVKRALSNKMFL